MKTTHKFTKSEAKKAAKCHREYLAGIEAGMNVLANRIAGGWQYERQTVSAKTALATFRGYIADQMADIRANLEKL